MRKIVTAALAAFLFLAAFPHATIAQENDADSGAPCAVERWNVKTLVDADVASVDFAPRPMTVEGLRALNGGKPKVTSMKVADAYANHRFEEEKHAVRVRAVLVGWKRETDKDFHIVIASPNDPSATMIAEPPDPACSTSPKASDFGKVRAAFVQCFGEPGRWKKLPPMVVDLDGLPFYDLPHGQTGHAPNAIELHPLLRVHTVSGTCPGGSQ